MSAAQAAADMRATAETTTMAAAEAAATVAAPTSSAAARERVSGQSRAQRGSRRQDDHGLP